MTDVRTAVPTLIAQLRAIQQLTGTEAQIAKIRVAQARTDEVRGELRRNSASAERRIDRIGREIAELGGVPDVVTPAVGRILSLVKSTVEQAQPLDEALLGDLALEHQLLDRARYVRGLAARAGRRSTEQLAETLVTAHTETVEWLTTVLAEEAAGGPAALVPTPLQRVTGGVTRAVSLPTRFAVERFNEAVAAVYRTGERARDGVDEVTDRVARLGSDTREVVTAGRDAALGRAERVARRDGADGTAEAVHAARRDLGVLSADELPVDGYPELNAKDAIAAVQALGSVDDVAAVLAFEEQHKDRAGVTSAARARSAEIARDSAGV